MRAFFCGLLSLACWVAFSSAAQACSCVFTPSPCGAYKTAGSAYLGEVVSSENVADTFRMTLRVIRADKATSTRQVVLTSDARTSCGVQLPVGRRYVIYAAVEDRSISACSFFFDALSEGDPEPQLPPRAGRVAGRIELYDMERIRSFDRLDGIPGAAVWMDLPLGRVSTTADGYGHFAFDDVPPGTHAIGVDAGPDLAPWMVKPVTLNGPSDCADASLVMHPSGKVAARVVDSEGRPAVGLPVVLLDAHASEVEYADVVSEAPTRERGEVVFHGLGAGEYLLAINPDGHTSGDRPYPPTFYGGTSRATATRLRIGGGRSAEPVTLTLPAPLPTRRLVATVTCTDGSIPPYIHASIRDIRDTRAAHAPSFSGNTLTMRLLHDRSYLLEVTASIPYGPASVRGRARRGEPLPPVQIAAGATDVQVSVLAPFADCAERFP